MLRFNDGMQFDTSGELRIISKSDGLYVCGKGMLMAIKDRAEGDKIIAEMSPKTPKGPVPENGLGRS